MVQTWDPPKWMPKVLPSLQSNWKISSPAQRFSLDPRQYVCSAVENTDGEIQELGCRMRAESEPSVEAELWESLFNPRIAIVSWSLQENQVSWNTKVKIAEDVWFCAAGQRKCDGLSWWCSPGCFSQYWELFCLKAGISNRLYTINFERWCQVSGKREEEEAAKFGNVDK